MLREERNFTLICWLKSLPKYVWFRYVFSLFIFLNIRHHQSMFNGQGQLINITNSFPFQARNLKTNIFLSPAGHKFSYWYMVISSKCHILPYKQYLAKTEDEFSGKTQWRNWITILRSFLITLCVRHTIYQKFQWVPSPHIFVSSRFLERRSLGEWKISNLPIHADLINEIQCGSEYEM